MSHAQFSLVLVPFPFTDSTESKRRPALVISDNARFNSKAEHCVLAMITSAKNSVWPLDVKITDLETAGLPAASVTRMKFFTLDNRLILATLGQLSPKDQKSVRVNLRKLFGVK